MNNNSKEKFSLAIDLRMINSSGIGVYLKNIIPLILEEIPAILLGDSKALATFKWAENQKIIEFTPSVYSLKEQFSYIKAIPEVDVFWCPHFNAPLFPIKAARLITTIYDVNHLANRDMSSFLKWRYAKLLYDNAVRKSEKVITISEFSMKELLRLTMVKEEKLEMIYCGVNVAKFRDNKGPIPEDMPRKYILYVGNVKPHKNLITLLKAYNALPAKLKEGYKLVILGKKEGFITPDLEIFRYIEEHKLMSYLHFTGYLEDAQVPAIYHHATLFVFPSLYEGFGLPPLEAMASGVPVLCSSAGSLPEVGGEAVQYFNPKDPSELNKELQALLTDPILRSSLVKKGIVRAAQFPWEKAGKAHLKVLRSLFHEMPEE
jgi:glycosyltransferase involved in cell wall biosynthesis